ncbi:MAG: group II intron reverse transcriptase/maturase [Rhodothermaceae bacterium]|nr:group II intron reverse transcriptase/maturase [Rhodothermaceae bacterium]MYH13443.1 group II intron reverse transcriptase/maturase [Rhodothermaceae bacterium]MYJ50923.1 group II intron reverse transcriptase/maturase [Rhodothermaceae bacterium]
MVVKQELEPVLEREFHSDSYGYRPNKSAHDALRQTRTRCWRRAWVLDMDIKAYFDTIDHELLMKAVRRHTDQKWVLLYIERWLTAPVIHPDGTEEARDVGTPQGGVISPLLANLFLYYAFDKWMALNYPQIPFERYADDIVCHCTSEEQARDLWQVLKDRFTVCQLTLHPDKTRIVYCKQTRRNGTYPNVSFDFLGYTLRPRMTMSREGRIFLGFNPAVSRKAAKAIRETIRSWGLARMSPRPMEYIAGKINATVRGWIDYYGAFFKSELRRLFQSINQHLIRWMMRKYKRFRGHWRRSWRWLDKFARQNSGLFVHWEFLYGPPLLNSKRLYGKSRVS